MPKALFRLNVVLEQVHLETGKTMLTNNMTSIQESTLDVNGIHFCNFGDSSHRMNDIKRTPGTKQLLHSL